MNFDYTHYKRGLTNWLDRQGFEYVDGHVIPHADSLERKEKFAVWLRESLLWAIGEIEVGRKKEALRGVLQCAGYAEVAGHDSITGDCFLTLRNHLEYLISGEVW